MISEWTSGDSAATDIMKRYDDALVFCGDTEKTELKNSIQENFNKLKNYQTELLQTNDVLEKNLLNL